MDTDISHAVEDRLSAIEARLDALEGNGTDEETDGEDGEDGDGEDNVSVSPEPVVSSRSRRSGRSSATTVDESGVISDVPEGGVA